VFRFVQALNNLRDPPQRQVENQPWRFRLADFPDHPSVSVASVMENGAEPDGDSPDGGEVEGGVETLISVSRPHLTVPPSPPDPLVAWLLRGWDDPFKDVPPVRESINIEDEAGTTRLVRFEDDASRPAALEAWSRARAQWAVAERPSRVAMRCFERCYELWSLVERDSESIELVLGDGVLEWNHASGRLHHPLVLQRVDLRFDASAATFTVVETESLPELYSALLQSLSDLDGVVLKAIREEFSAGAFHPLGGDATSAFLRATVMRLSPAGHFLSDDDEPHPSGDKPSVRRSPVLFLRPRTSGFAACIQDVIDDIAKGGPIPPSLIGIVGDPDQILIKPGDAPPSEPVTASAPPDSRDEQILFTLPANPEQLRIAQRLANDGAVLVQGPPGTGKTHTIANLLGHLLAQGKSVLVTSHTTKALRVLRDKVVGDLQPLCISVLESDSEGRRQLEGSVGAIAEQLTRTDIGQSEARASALRRERAHLEGQVRDKVNRLMQARADEYRPIVFAGKSYEPSAAARDVTGRRATDSWIPGAVSLGAPMPLSKEQIERLYTTSSLLCAEDEAEIEQSLPDASLLPLPDEFDAIVAEREALEGTRSVPNSIWWPSPSPETSAAEIEGALEKATTVASGIAGLEPWKKAVALAGLRGSLHCAPWEQLLILVASARELSGKAQGVLATHAPAFGGPGESHDLLPLIREVLGHLRSGRGLGRIQVGLRPRWKSLLGQVSIRGATPRLPEHFKALELLAMLEGERRELRRRWDALVSPHGGPTSRELGGEPEIALDMIAPVIRSLLEWHSARWMKVRSELDGVGFRWEAFEQDQPVEATHPFELARIVRAAGDSLRLAFRPMLDQLRWAQLETSLSRWRSVLATHEATHGALSETSNALRAAMGSLVASDYRSAHERLVALSRKQGLRNERAALLAALRPTAPGWSDAIASRLSPHDRGAPPGDASAAWHWRQLHDELRARAETSIEDLQLEIRALQDQVRNVTSDLTSCSAWAEQAKRTSLRQRQALFNWLGAVKRLGRHGTVKLAARLKREAQDNLTEARSAVPVWIMPVSRVVDSFRASSTRFDVAIIDEASQCDLSALVVLYFARAVVGDHEQVSPVAVGEDQAWLASLIDEYLARIPGKALFGGRRSVYDLAQGSFGDAIRLVEHFRCVPDIIAFSNQLSYENKIKPLREPGSSPLLPPLVPYRVQSSAELGAANREEALAIASLVLAICEEPAYANATLGVISMVGEDTAREVETILLRHIEPAAHMQRRIRCGNPAQFQGDERDVMFIAMVDTPKNGPLPRNRQTDDWKKRFNVAASRARDQLWVVHSLDPQTDLQPDDLRKRLIDHAINPAAISDALQTAVARAESKFEIAVIERLMLAGYRVKPQFRVGHYRIDIVVEGRTDEGRTRRLAVECDGDRYHPPEKLADDLARQELLERLGWRFARIRGSSFGLDPAAAMRRVFDALREEGIEPLGPATEPDSRGTESDVIGRIVRRAAEMRAAWTEEAQAGDQTDRARARSSRRAGVADEEAKFRLRNQTPWSRLVLSGHNRRLQPRAAIQRTPHRLLRRRVLKTSRLSFGGADFATPTGAPKVTPSMCTPTTAIRRFPASCGAAASRSTAKHADGGRGTG
jgi:very-short-patch-repair endonuclease